MRMRTLTGLLLALAIAVPAALQAQDETGPLTWVAYTRVKPGKTQDWVKLSLGFDKPLLEKLRAEGAVLTWGYAVRANHRPGYKWNVISYVTCPNWAGIDTWVGALMGAMAAESPEARERAQADFAELEEEGSHFDEVVRQVMMKQPDTPKKFSYFYVSHYRAHPGNVENGTRLIQEGVTPVADELMAAGKIGSYGMSQQALHNQHQPERAPWTHRVWYTLTDLSAIDLMDAGYAARITPERQKMRAENFDFDAHTDDILASLYHSPSPE